jgi:DNA-binding CsgD family transcriptional regulator
MAPAPMVSIGAALRMSPTSKGSVQHVMLYRTEPEPVDAAVALRCSRAHIAIVDENGFVVAANPAARRRLDAIEPCTPNRLPRALERIVRDWFRRGCEAELTVSPAPGFIVRAMSLGDAARHAGLIVEEVSTREHLSTAARQFGLSPRERDVLRLLLEGDSACEIAGRLGIAEYTVGDYIKRIFAKTRVRNRSEMIAKVLGWRPAVRELSENGVGRAL